MSHLITRRQACMTIPAAAAFALCAARPAGAAAAPLSDLIARSRKESHLEIYSNVGTLNWEIIVKAFNQKYPWIRVEALDIGPEEAFERYYAESASGHHSADVIVAASPTSWLRFIDKGELMPVASAEAAQLPAWSKPYPGLYTFSTDPLILVYNKMMLPPNEQPQTLAQLAQLVSTDSGRFRDRITTYDATSHPFALAAHWTYAHVRGWNLLNVLGPATRPESSSGSMIEKITTGEYSAGYFVSGVSTFVRTLQTARDKLIGWSLMKDGTLVFARGMGIPKRAVSTASARLFLEYALSHEGQVTIGQAGLTPYRPDVKTTEVPYLTYGSIAAEIGEKNVMPILYDRALVTDQNAFLARWKKVYGM
ncbi:MAG: extracellular solute-binding protein [Gammaproteobacteria bacterium]|nr:extracellular solute-binding protein [Gammaproteobacteria bacterium]